MDSNNRSHFALLFCGWKISYMHLIFILFIFFCPLSRRISFFLITTLLRGGSRTAATSKMERFLILVNGWKPLNIITKRSILDVAAVLDPPLVQVQIWLCFLSRECNRINLGASFNIVSIYVNI